MSFTAEELAALRLFDEEIDREFEAGYVPDCLQKELDAYLDEIAILQRLTHQEARERRLKAAYREFERKTKGEQLKAYRAEWYSAHREQDLRRRSSHHFSHLAEERDSKRIWYLKNKEAHNAKSREYYQEHREKRKEQNAAYLKAHKEEIKAKKAAYYREHREEILARQKDRAKERKERLAFSDNRSNDRAAS